MGCLHLGEHMSRVLEATSITFLQPVLLPLVDLKERIETPPSNGTADTTALDASLGEDPATQAPLNPLGSAPTLDIVTIISAVLSYLIAFLLFFLAPDEWRPRATFALLLAPPGAMLRFFFARYNARPPYIDRFFLGTFIVNISASLLIGGIYAALYRPAASSSPILCDALLAIRDGFCGCLSTVSTFVVEARAIRGVGWKWVYILSSVVLGHITILVTLGAVGWSQGFEAQCTG